MTPSLFKEKNYPFLMLAPLEGITNAAFRSCICELGGLDSVATEFVRITGPKQGVKPFSRIPGVPLQIQLMGTDAYTLSQVILFLKSQNILFDDDWIDLNVGCPSRRVNASGAGASLLLDPAKLAEIITAMRESHSGPLSIKTRIGFDTPDAFGPLLNRLAAAPLDFITIHARTRCGGYKEPINLELLKLASTTLPYPVIGNGDIWTAEDALNMLQKTGVRGIMCGRGAVRNPLLFHEIRAAITSTRLNLDPATTLNILGTFTKSLSFKLSNSEKKPGYRIGVFKEYATWLSKNPIVGRDFFQGLKRLTEWSAIFSYLETYFPPAEGQAPSEITSLTKFS